MTGGTRAIPSGWTRAALRDVAVVLRGVTYEKSQSSPYPGPGLTPILRANNIDRKLDFEDLVFVPRRCVSAQQMLQPGDIVIAASSGSRNVVGKAAPLSARWEGSFGAFCFALRPSHHCESRFVSWFLQGDEYRNRVSALAAGININNLRRQHIEDLAIPLPPLEEQHRIVAEVDKHFTRLDDAVAALKRAQANLKRYRAAVLKAACEGRLVPTEAALARAEGRDYETAACFLKRLGVDTASNEARGGRPSRGLAEGWACTTVSDVASVGTGATPLRSKAAYFESGTIPWVTSGALNSRYVDAAGERITELALKETNAKVFPVGTLLVAMYGEGKTRGKVSELHIAAATNQACAALVFSPGMGCLRPFVKLFFDKNYEDIRKESSGGVQPNLNLSIVKGTLVPVPPFVEQERILEEVERRQSVIEAQDRLVEASLRRTNRLRQSILKRAFEGRLVPQDPNNEPASALLARIKAERSSFPLSTNGRQRKTSRPNPIPLESRT